MIRVSLFRLARIALATVMVALAAFGHVYGKAHHDHGQPEQRLAWTNADKPHAYIATASALLKFAPPSASQPDEGVVNERACGCCFSGCGCCSTALWRQTEDFAPPAMILAESLSMQQPDVPSGLLPKSLFRPPRLTA
jgi:hypothetical protein